MTPCTICGSPRHVVTRDWFIYIFFFEKEKKIKQYLKNQNTLFLRTPLWVTPLRMLLAFVFHYFIIFDISLYCNILPNINNNCLLLFF